MAAWKRDFFVARIRIKCGVRNGAFALFIEPPPRRELTGYNSFIVFRSAVGFFAGTDAFPANFMLYQNLDRGKIFFKGAEAFENLNLEIKIRKTLFKK